MMMRIFLSYKFNRIPINELYDKIDPLIEILNMHHEVYCNLHKNKYFMDNSYTTKMIMEDSLAELNKCDYFIIFIDINKYSRKEIGEGMAIEFGYAYKMNIPRLVLIHKSVISNSLKSLATNVIEFEDLYELYEKIKNFKLV